MKRLILVALCLLVNHTAAAQDKSGAEAVMLKYAAATKTYDTKAMTALMHPDALKRLSSTIDAALQGSKGDMAEAQLLPMFSVTSSNAFSALSDAERYKRLNDTIAKSAPELLDMMSKSEYEIVGTTVKDGTAYVTYNLKMPIQGRAVSTQAVQTLKMHDGKWLLMLPSTSEATIANIEAQFK